MRTPPAPVWLALAAGLSASPARAQRPDLVVDSIDLRDAGRLGLVGPTAGSRIQITVTLRNRTSTASSGSSLTCGRSTTQSGALAAQQTVGTPPLGGGGSAQLALDVGGPASAGPGWVRCEIDPNQQVAETDEANNTTAVAFDAEPNDFRIQLGSFGSWTRGYSDYNRYLPFRVTNLSGRSIRASSSGKATARWQAQCVVPQLPNGAVLDGDDLMQYPGGSLPAPGQATPDRLFLSGMGHKDSLASQLPATLQLTCTVTVGAFTAQPVLHPGDRSPSTDWVPIQVWWRQGFVYSIANPDSKAYRPPLDIVMGSVTGSAAAQTNQPPLIDRPTYARFSVTASSTVPSLVVACGATGPGTTVQPRTVTVANVGSNTAGVVDLGTLAQGTWSVRCEVDPGHVIPETNRGNNLRSAQVTVLTPGPDLVVSSIDARDGSRLLLTRPSAGRPIRLMVTVRNQSGGPAPDVDLVCRRTATPGGAPLSQQQVMTGPLGASAQRVVNVTLAGASQPGQSSVSCNIDGGGRAVETIESNNVLTQPLVSEPDGPAEFAVALSNLGPWKPGANQNERYLSFKVTNVSSRGAMLPPNGALRARWQAECHLAQLPSVRVRLHETPAWKYPGGNLPSAGQSATGEIYLFGFVGAPVKVEDLPPSLQLLCKLTVGAFQPNAAVVHAGDGSTPHPDWQVVQVWWTQSVIYTIANPDAR